MVHECVNTGTQKVYRRRNKCPVRNKSVLHACFWQSSHFKEGFPLVRQFSATKRFSEEGNIAISSIYNILSMLQRLGKISNFTNQFVQKLSQRFSEIFFWNCWVKRKASFFLFGPVIKSWASKETNSIYRHSIRFTWYKNLTEAHHEIFFLTYPCGKIIWRWPAPD